MCCRDYKEDKKEWGWVRPPPISQKQGGDPDTPKKLRKKVHDTHTPACKVIMTGLGHWTATESDSWQTLQLKELLHWHYRILCCRSRVFTEHVCRSSVCLANFRQAGIAYSCNVDSRLQHLVRMNLYKNGLKHLHYFCKQHSLSVNRKHCPTPVSELVLLCNAGFRAGTCPAGVHVQGVQWHAGAACQCTLWPPLLQALPRPPLPGLPIPSLPLCD